MRTHHWFNSQRQLLNRLEDGLIELIRSPCIRCPIKSFADVGAGEPKFGIARFGDHRVLHTLASNRPTFAGRKLTRMVVRRTLAEVNTVLAGITVVACFARSSPPMAAFNEERTPFLPFSRWDLSVMVETEGSHEEAVWRGD